MDFRDYDPAIARWTGIDPVTHHNMSPYMAFDGNPVFWADPSGADSTDGYTLDVFGRDRFDSNGMYIPFSDRGVGSFDEYLSQDGGGDAIGTLVYTLLDDKNNIHQISFTEYISSQVRYVSDQFLVFKILFDYVSVTTTIEIKMVNNELIFNTTQVTTYGTTELGGSGFKECNSKTITRSNSGLSMSDIANRAANFIGNQLKVNPEYNMFNQPRTVMPVGSGLGMSAIQKLTGQGFGPIPLAAELAETWDHYTKKWSDYSGKSATYKVYKDGSTKLEE